MDPERQLARFIAKFSKDVATVANAALAKMRKRLPGAIELVYDNYNALAIGFGPTEKTTEIIFSIALYPRWVSLFFAHGIGLTDPKGLLRGSGNQVRHIVLDDANVLDKPAVRALMTQAVKRSPKQIDRTLPNRICIKSISARQRPRRPSGKSM
jgi:hypothetical protein